MTEKLKKIKRRQLTLFLSESCSSEIEKCRERFNLEQFKLIKAHITLCREDEIEQLEKVNANLNKMCFNSFDLELGKPIRFSDNKGVLIPVVGNEVVFQNLRAETLKGVIEFPRSQKPHITIMHPRNSSCNNEIFETISNLKLPNKLRFNKINLIEQTFGESWTILEEYKLKN